MVLPVLQSLLTLGLLVAAFGFMAKRLWRIGVLINTGTRGDETLTDARASGPGRCSPTPSGQKRLKEDAAAGLLHGVFLYGFLVLGLGHFEVDPRGPDRLPAGLRRAGPSSTSGSCRPGSTRSTTSARTCWPPPSSWPASLALVRRLHGQPAPPPAAVEGRREDPLVHRRPLRHLLRPRRRDRPAEAAGGGRPGRPAVPALQLARRARPSPSSRRRGRRACGPSAGGRTCSSSSASPRTCPRRSTCTSCSRGRTPGSSAASATACRRGSTSRRPRSSASTACRSCPGRASSTPTPAPSAAAATPCARPTPPGSPSCR